MSNPDFIRSKALNNIPYKKLQESLFIINHGDDSLVIKNVKLIAINRYAESNIPVEYWTLKMERDFKGDPRLLNKYTEYTNDLKKAFIEGNSICFAGGHGLGKMLDLETELPTPNGFIKLKDLKEGDQLFDEQGNICNVTKLHPINLTPESYEIIFDDGTTINACADHLWLTYTRKNRKNKTSPTIKSTKEIINSLHVGGKQKISNHSIPCTKPLTYSEKNLPIDPYLFGLWLGDGDIYNAYIESADLELFDNFNYQIIPSSIRDNSKSVAVKISGLRSCLKKLNMIKRHKQDVILTKHIPDDFLYSSYNQRLALLQGILDSDGNCNKNGTIEYCTVFPLLAEQVCQLIKSFGIKTKIKVNKSYLYNTRHKDRYRITFSTTLPVFKLERKLSNIKKIKSQLTRTTHRFIVGFKEIKPIPMRCITVDSSSHLFLATRSFIATHNTMAITCILKKAVQKGYTCLYTTLSDIVAVLTTGSTEDKYQARRELALVEFLAIDEFDPRFMPSENAADLYARSLESVFRTRSQNKLPTLMGTNSPNPVESFHGPLKVSIDSLMKGYIETFPVFPGKDFRKEKHEQ